jgi:hypothetical protein
MVPPRARSPRAFARRLRLEHLEDRLTLGDAGPLVAAVLSGVGELRIIDFDGLGGQLATPRSSVDIDPTNKLIGGVGLNGSSGGGVSSVATSGQSGTDVILDGGDSPSSVPPQSTDGAPGGGGALDDGTATDGFLAARAEVMSPAGAAGVSQPAPASHTPRVESGAPTTETPLPQPAAENFIGPLPTPDVVAHTLRVTAANRNSATMSGGWNPALRGILIMKDGSRWFAAETGANTMVNSAMIYYRLGPTGWKAVGSVALPPGIQQNMATITNGRFIYAYGVTPGAVIETWFDTTRPRWNLATGNAIAAGGVALPPGAQANYVGAAWRNNTRIVWWTSVGSDGSGGQWAYAYNSGRGWNGPVVSGLGGYTDVGYVRARFDDLGRMHMIGEGYVGQYPAGHRYLMTATAVLGRACRWIPVLPAVARSPLDLWRTDGGATQFLYRIGPNRVGYSFGANVHAVPTEFKAMQARFISNGDQLGLVLGFKHWIEVRLVPLSAAAGPIDWASVAPITLPLPAAFKSAGVSAIWTADDSRQPYGSDRLEFAVCGGYPARDNLIYYVTL